MLIESQNKSRNDQKSTEKFEVVKHRKYCKPRSIENEPINCQNRYETLDIHRGNDEESENSSSSFTSSPEETPDNTPNQVRSRISKKKRLKSKSTITMDEETNRNSTKPIANQWYQLRQDNNINHYISQSPVETVKSSYSNIVSKKKKIIKFIDSILKNLLMEEFNSFVKEGEVYLKAFPGAQANQLNYQTIPVIQGNNYDAAAIHVGINDFLLSIKSINDICRDIISIGLRCRSNNISKVFVSSIAYSAKINMVLMQRLDRALYDEC